MRLPGFNASSTLYRTSGQYRIAVGRENDPGASRILPLAASPVPSPRQPLSEVIPEVIGPFPYVLCQPCVVNQSGECTQYCVHCPTPRPGPGCWVSFPPCAPGECCPSGQSPCYIPGKSQSCCEQGYSCCDPETGFCCPPWETCCNPQTKVCCPPGQDLAAVRGMMSAVAPVLLVAVAFAALRGRFASRTAFAAHQTALRIAAGV